MTQRVTPGLGIQLLGSPRLELHGAPLPAPRGHKAWCVLAYLLRTRVAPSRERLASLLFPEAADPLGALRWTLSSLRSCVGPGVRLGGDPLRLELPPGTFVDVDVLSRGSWVEAIELPGLGHDLLDGVVLRSAPGFELWLEAERRHVAGIAGAVLHQAALALLARGDGAAAARHAAELVRLDPYEENAHVLLVRCLRAAGDTASAVRQVQACTELFTRELGLVPTPALHDAAATVEVSAAPRVSGRATVLAQLELGAAALAAGEAEAGVQRMRGAVAAARKGDGGEVLACSLVALGSALVHSARGTDEEGVAALHEGTTLAERANRSDLAATGWREIGWVQFLRAQYDRAEESLTTTAALAGESEEELAWVDLIRGACRHDRGDHAAAGELLRRAVERAERLSTDQPLGQALTLLGRFHLLRGEIEDAVHLLDRALAEVEARRMTAFTPWPESFRGEIDLLLGDVDAAEARFEHAFALGCQVGDPCWESISLRGLGLAVAARGDVPRALEFLVDAPRLCRRLPDTYSWIEVYALDALCSVAVEHGAEATAAWLQELETVAARRGMAELVLRALVYRARLGDAHALELARASAAQIANPALARLLASAEPAVGVP